MTFRASARTKHPRQRSLVLFALASACTVAYCTPAAQASNLEGRLKTKYQYQVLTLRRFYEGRKLQFDSRGNLMGESPVGPWTVYGQIRCTAVHLVGQTLHLKGLRRRLFADPASEELKDVLEAGTSGSLRNQFRYLGSKGLREFEEDAKIEIDIDLASVPKDEPEVTSAVNAVFLSPGDDLAKVMPGFWKAIVLRQEGKPQIDEPASGVCGVESGTEVSPPHAISAGGPEFSEIARQVGFDGTVILSLVVTPEGIPSDISVIRPLGLGLDEQALQAVSNWKFEPARKEGVPMPCRIHVETTFRLH
jgi:TonB family protein